MQARAGHPFPGRFAWLPALRQIRRRRAVILGYHGIADSTLTDDPYRLQLAPERFRAQIEMLLEAGFEFTTVAELAERASGGPPPPGLGAVTFDDAFRNNATTALPILRELGIPATVYVPTSWIGGHSNAVGPGGDGEILSGPELRELSDVGWELGAHTVTHADLSLLDYEACRSEVADSCAELERVAGVTVQTFAYPFGRYSEAAIRAVRDVGLLAAVTTGSGRWHRYELTRAMVGGADPFAVTLLKLTDRYEPLTTSIPGQLVQRLRERSHRPRRT